MIRKFPNSVVAYKLINFDWLENPIDIEEIVFEDIILVNKI